MSTQPSAPTSSQSVSVVICAYASDRWRLLQAAVASVERQSLPPKEIVVVIDHNDDLLEQAASRWPQHRVVTNRHARGLSGARNSGVEAAGGQLVAFLDDDAEAHVSWLGAMCERLEDPGVGGIGGAVIPAWIESQPEWFPDEFLWVVGCGYKGLPRATAPIRNPIGASMAFRASVLASTGGFREGIGRVGTLPVGCEETELSIRTRELGFEILYEPSSRIHHVVPPERATPRYFLRRCRMEGRSKAIVASMVGSGPALASERTYLTRVLPRGIVRALGDMLRGPRRSAALLRSVAIVVGLVTTAAGYAEGRWVLARRQRLGD